MNEPQSPAQRLRADFDGAYAEALRSPPEDGANLLALKLGGDPYALRMGDIARVMAGSVLVPLPSKTAAFLGLVGLGGEILPVWDLGSLLGYPRSRHTPRWLASSAGAPHWALAFEAFDGTLKASLRDFSPPYSGGGPAAALAVALCATGGHLRPVLSFEKLLQSIHQGELR